LTGRAVRPRLANSSINRLSDNDAPVHEWYRFVLSFPPHLVRDYVEKFALSPAHRLLDPFCGTGTTLVEAKKLGIPSVGIEANPVAAFASRVKVNWNVDPDGLRQHAVKVARCAARKLRHDGLSDEPLPLFRAAHRPAVELRTLPSELMDLLLDHSISPLPLHKTLTLLDCLRKNGDERFLPHELLAFAKSTVAHASNLHFGPEVGVGKPKPDVPVVSAWLREILSVAEQLADLPRRSATPAAVLLEDARDLLRVIKPHSIDAVITSPPYPNEKDYTRTTRLESVLLGFITAKKQLQDLKKTLVRSNTRGVYKNDDDDQWIVGHPKIQAIAEAIEKKRLAMGKNSGFERLYHRVTKLYFGGMARHLAELREALRPGAKLAYVVGDQASYLQIMIRTGELLGEIAESLGYELVSIDLFRQRLSTATRQFLNEEVVVLRWPG
jgi:DNA modification methylase